MSAAAPEHDVAIVGASTAGCTAARLFALRGARVALIERRPSVDAYKTVCTHYILACATPTIEKLGLARLLDERGAVHNSVKAWTPTGGWIPAREGGPHGYSVTRRTLDPMLRTLAAETPGVDLLSGWTARALLGHGRPEGVEIESPSHERRRVRARLVVGADGRESRVARWAGLRGRVTPHGRFFYWSYWRGLRPESPVARTWFLDPDVAYTFPMEDGLTVMLVGPQRDRLPEFRADLEGAYMRMVRSLPDAPDFSDATREGKLLGKLDLPQVMRPAAAPGIALVGDAALASDPFWGVGCGWAFQSADWLVDETAEALATGGDLDAALGRYRRAHRRRLLPHQLTIASFATGRLANPIERRIWRAAARDQRVAETFHAITERRISPLRALDPRLLLKIP